MTAILFVHGYMGCARQFDILRDALAGDCAHFCVTLPRHDSDIDEFTKVKRGEWQRYVDNEIERLRAEYDEIILVGHSMGGALLINAATRNPEKIAGICAISLPLRVKITIKAVKTRLRALRKPKPGESAEIAAAREMCGVRGVGLFNSCRLLPSIFILFGVTRAAKANLSRLRAPLVVINSRRDEIVSMKTVGLIHKLKPTAKTIIMDDSTHFYFTQIDIKRIARAIEIIGDAARAEPLPYG